MNTARKKKANSENDTLIAWEFDNVFFLKIHFKPYYIQSNKRTSNYL